MELVDLNLHRGLSVQVAQFLRQITVLQELLYLVAQLIGVVFLRNKPVLMGSKNGFDAFVGGIANSSADNGCGDERDEIHMRSAVGGLGGLIILD